MKSESIAYGIAGVAFGLIAGWIIGTQQAAPRVAPAPAQAAAAPAANAPSERAAILDETRVTALKSVAEQQPSNAQPRVELANLYFDAERYDDAITWYQAALKITPDDVNLSTDLGVCYYYTNQADKALLQLSHSLSIDPKHAKTLLNIGIVKAFGKQDLEGATKVWQQVVDLGPDTPEGQAAKRALDTLKSAHPADGRTEAGRLAVFRLALFVILSIFIARAFWRLVDGVIEGLSGRPAGAGREIRGVPMARDPVCGTYVVPDRSVAIVDGRQQVFFCSTVCRDKYRMQAG